MIIGVLIKRIHFFVAILILKPIISKEKSYFPTKLNDKNLLF